MIYLDNAATTQIAPEVLEAMMPYLQDQYGNAGTLYSMGRRAAEAIAKARQQVADFMGAKPDQIIFTSGGTEANNLAIIGCTRYLAGIGKKRIVTSIAEHDSVLRAIDSLCKPLRCNDEKCIKDEFYMTFLPVGKDGRVSFRALRREVQWRHDIGLVSVMHMNNEVGAMNNIRTIGRICRTNNILFHTDCVQAAGTIALNVDDATCDFMSISSHKIHGPKGVGALYVRDKKYLSALINGGEEQEFGLRGGTENVAGIVGFGKACELASQGLSDHVNTVIYYKRIFYDLLQEHLSQYDLNDIVRINGCLPRNPGKTLSLTFNGVDAETLVLMLDSRGVCISAGSACRSRESHPSRVLLAMGMTDREARSTVRISFSEFNEYHEVERAAKLVADCVKSLRSVDI